ncbi:hypothetical protein GSI_07856 [Ganoderma sinense ZZ0214-1]|uniref:Uncharacterized protein n=1 Tax=Ganoderma sinense ZZ0214-1 TaxID=1077348 RepID=A0A2G8S869_9APHY|nr:hypothetical protein GSI_07856 [Ganoderma sinense ZZ0214-1]
MRSLAAVSPFDSQNRPTCDDHACGSKAIDKATEKLIKDGLVYDDRYNSLTKLRDREKTLNDEKNLFKRKALTLRRTSHDFVNTAVKNEFPRSLVQATQFIDTLFLTFYRGQLDIFYVSSVEMNGFDVSILAA